MFQNKTYYFLLLLLFLVISSCSKTASKKQDNSCGSIYSREDSLMVLEKMEQFKKENTEQMPLLLEKIGRSFIGSPYKPHTLEIDDKERLVINLREFDCTTFVETCLALSNTIKTGNGTFGSYRQTLKRIRYRKGHIAGYTSRLHYFSDWITDNSLKGYVEDVTEKYNGVPYPNEINFMSTHIPVYQQLVKDTKLIPGLKEIEKKIAERRYFYIPKEEIAKAEPHIGTGMIVAFTTNIKGLDIIHVGITTCKNGRVYLVHASSDAGKVVVSHKPLAEYIAGNRLQTGIMLLQVE